MLSNCGRLSYCELCTVCIAHAFIFTIGRHEWVCWPTDLGRSSIICQNTDLNTFRRMSPIIDNVLTETINTWLPKPKQEFSCGSKAGSVDKINTSSDRSWMRQSKSIARYTWTLHVIICRLFDTKEPSAWLSLTETITIYKTKKDLISWLYWADILTIKKSEYNVDNKLQ